MNEYGINEVGGWKVTKLIYTTFYILFTMGHARHFAMSLNKIYIKNENRLYSSSLVKKISKTGQENMSALFGRTNNYNFISVTN